MQVVTWTDALKIAQQKHRMHFIPKELEQLKSKNILRVSLSGWSNALLDFLNDALMLGCKYLEELSIHFAINTDETPFHPTGDHANYLNYFNSFLPDKYINDEETIINEPMKICYTDKFDQILTTIQKNVKYATNLKILAFYAPPVVNEDIMFHLPETLKAFIIHSCSNLKIDIIPDVELISLKNCYLNDENSGFILDSLKQYQEGHKKQLRKFMLKVFGPCARHTPEDEIQKYFSERDKLLLKYQATDEDIKCIQYIDLSFNNLNYRFLDAFGEFLQQDQFLQYIDLNNNQFGHFVQRISLDPPTPAQKGAKSGENLKNSGARVARPPPSSTQILSGGAETLKYSEAIKPSALHSLKVTSEILDNYKAFLLAGFTPNFYRVPTADTISFLSRYCETATETAELTALRTHPLVLALEKNSSIFMLSLSGTASCLQRFVQVRVMHNRKQLLEALQNVGNGHSGIFAGPQELLKCDFKDIESWQAQHKDLRLLFHKFDAKMSRNHGGCGCGAGRQMQAENNVQIIKVQQKPEMPTCNQQKVENYTGTSSKASSLRTVTTRSDSPQITSPQKKLDTRKIGSGLSGNKEKNKTQKQKNSLSASKQSSSTFRSRRETEQDLQLLTKKEKKLSALLSGRPVSSKKRPSSVKKEVKVVKQPKMKRVPSGSELNTESEVPSSQLNQGPMHVKYQNDSQDLQIVNTGTVQRKAGAYINEQDLKDHTATQFSIQQPVNTVQSITTSQLNIANQSAADFNKLMDQVVDDTFDTILFLSSNDKMRAKNIFSENQDKINNFCQLVVSDLSAGRIRQENIKGVLFDYIQNLVK